MTQRPGAPERLDSWKAIAEYLDRDVATVRRWEKSLGLPVRRVAGGPGRSVFAFRHEIDEWLKADRASLEPQLEPAPEPPAPAVLPSPVHAQRRWRWPFAVATAAVIIGALAWRTRAPEAQPAGLTIDVTSTGIVARQADGAERWRYAFPPDLRATVELTRVEGGATTLQPPYEGVLAAVAYSASVADHATRSGELVWLDSRGSLLRRFAFDDEVPFGERHYGAPWVITDYRTHPDRGPQRVVAAAHHFQWWPSLVTVLDGEWRRAQTFVHAGWIEWVRWVDRDRLLIAGYSNPFEGGMVALLDGHAMNGQMPSNGRREFECSSCGPDRPLRYIVLPRSEVNVVTGSPFNRAVLQVADHRFVVRTIEVPAKEHGTAIDAVYEFTPALDLLSASYGDRYWDTHRSLELEGRIQHPRETCPERNGPRAIRVWEPATGWRTIPR